MQQENIADEIYKKYGNLDKKSLKVQQIVDATQKPYIPPGYDPNRYRYIPRTGDKLNMTGMRELGENVKNINKSINNARLMTRKNKINEVKTSKYNKSGNVMRPNYLTHMQYGYTPEEFQQKQISKLLGKTSTRPNKNNFAKGVMHTIRQLKTLEQITDTMEIMLNLDQNSDEFRDMANNFKTNIYRLIEQEGSAYSAKSRSDEVLKLLLTGIEDKKKRQQYTNLYNSIIPQDRELLNSEIESFTTVIEESNPMFASKGGRARKSRRKVNKKKYKTKKH